MDFDICNLCNYGKMISQKYLKTFNPDTCDICNDDGCPMFIKIILDGKSIIAYREIRGNELVPGDLYIAKRNTGWHLGKCLKVNHEYGWVMSDPPCKLYSYNCNECYKVLCVNNI